MTDRTASTGADEWRALQYFDGASPAQAAVAARQFLSSVPDESALTVSLPILIWTRSEAVRELRRMIWRGTHRGELLDPPRVAFEQFELPA